MNKIKIYLADLTHNGMILSSNVFPLSIGLVAAYLLDKKPNDVEIDLFKYPEDLSAALEEQAPDIIGFANYSWNFNISIEYMKLIKKLWPDTIVVFGGPNYAISDEEIEQFWKINKQIDFYVAREGEESFLQLVEALIAADLDVNAVKNKKIEIGNVHYAVGTEIVHGPDLPRLDVAEIPSPYLMGLMDKFFDENLGPMIHTTRGCPFQCAFCTEGTKYYNKVSQREDQLAEEMEYISSRVRGPKDLYISDANFGMFKQDYAKAEIIANCQEKYNYPKYIHVSTGKNQKERVVEIIQTLNGAVSMAASLQSTDSTVLKNVARSNISIDKLSSVGQMANTVNTGTYSELILGLPGDSISAHFKSLRDTVEMRFDNIRMYQLIMLPQTELNTPENRRKYGMKTMYRIMPRSFGRYSVAGHELIGVESEEILVSNDTLPFDEYIACREMDLTIEILHNGKIFSEIQGVCQALELSWFDFILHFYENRREYSKEVSNMYDTFKKGTSEQLWTNQEKLVDYVRDNIDEMLNDERGTNEMSYGKATSFFLLFEQMNELLFSLLASWLDEQDLLNDVIEQYLNDLKRFSLLRKQNLLDCDAEVTDDFSFDMQKLENCSFKMHPNEVKLDAITKFNISHNPHQRELIISYSAEFGDSFDGLGKMLMRYPHIHRLFRKANQIH